MMTPLQHPLSAPLPDMMMTPKNLFEHNTVSSTDYDSRIIQVPQQISYPVTSMVPRTVQVCVSLLLFSIPRTCAWSLARGLPSLPPSLPPSVPLSVSLARSLALALPVVEGSDVSPKDDDQD
jgi:hypothetical protein